ncbi:MAG: hypothetical protein Q4B22_09500 [Eubacteriales bacterium]|nr:hypothetical protein [Eubacteriales bacterium]
MAASYNVLKCHGCASTRFDFDKKRKVWICAYCGNEIQKTAAPTDEPLQHAVKQVLTDLAQGRMESAAKNVIECEKISADNVCTVIANLSIMVFRLITNSCPEGERPALFGQMKRRIAQLKEISGNTISAEEEELYNSAQMEGDNDAFAVLFLVFDMLDQKVHREMVENYLDVGKVCAKALNHQLLDYSSRNKRMDMLEAILKNTKYIDCTEGLWKALEYFEDGDKKCAILRELFASAQLHPEDRKNLTVYLQKAPDRVDTKVQVYSLAAEKGVVPSIEETMDALTMRGEVSDEQMQTVIEAFSRTRPKDAELYSLIENILEKHAGRNALTEMKVLMNSDLFIKFKDKDIYGMIRRRDWSTEERLEMLKLIEQCKMDARTNDGILAEILLHVSEVHEERMKLIREMCKYVSTVSTPVLKEYILNCTLDGENKPEVLQELLNLDLNMSFFRDLLGQYARSTADSAPVKKEVTRLLSGQGLAIDSESLLDLAIGAEPSNYADVIASMQQAVHNGTRIGNADLSTYLEKVEPAKYHPAIMGLLHTNLSVISDEALALYVLYAEEGMPAKLQNSLLLAEQNRKPFGSSICRIKIFGADVSCNLLQAYVLLASDSVGAIETIIGAMKDKGSRLNPVIQVNGTAVKFKKFIVDNRSRLSPLTNTICEAEGVFKLFF